LSGNNLTIISNFSMKPPRAPIAPLRKDDFRNAAR
jgi:hypothetical protein